MNFKNFKLTTRDKLLLILFIVCSIFLIWLSYSLNIPVHNAHTALCNMNGMLVAATECNRVLCMADSKVWSARADGMCYSMDGR